MNSSPSSYSIPIGFLARQQRVADRDVRFYCDDINLESSVFIVKSYNWISFIHTDLYSSSFSFQDFEAELKYHQDNNNSNNNNINVWRCHVIAQKQPNSKPLELNEMEEMWRDIQSNKCATFEELNVHETTSIAHSDASPKLSKLKATDLAPSPISDKLLQSIKLVNELVNAQQEGQQQVEQQQQDNNNNSNGLLIFNNGWVQEKVEQLCKINDKAIVFIEKDPNASHPFIKALEKQMSNGEYTVFKSKCYDAINNIRLSQGKGAIKQIKVSPNETCPCKQQGKKFKKCCESQL
ncbi:hypothetical protein DFA_02149 [Cavenderia fasciculata]|uniref:Uncharacterized protein n=1 Tax=Cavenderia fasciculata TaxID=261658 RepID=F4PY95_CACFS|nr:uncharacterized protein DFA_02149 [Cavenderia fasciculata]EGG19362.1 hypothetical protein DFA_02149 [Cavenderia fasciculata]|eukprot:XP_004357633.1 hypothetical protein DFA_02149 [Cavenderia fasciculata]